MDSRFGALTFTTTPSNLCGCWPPEGDPYDHPPCSLPSSTTLPQAGLSFDVEPPHAECGGAPTPIRLGRRCGSSVRLCNPCGSSVTRGYACHIPPPCQSFATFSCEGMGTPGNTCLQTLPQPLSPPPSTAALHDPVNESALLRVYVSRVNATPKHGDYEVGGTSAKLSGVLRECAAPPSATASAGQGSRHREHHARSVLLAGSPQRGCRAAPQLCPIKRVDKSTIVNLQYIYIYIYERTNQWGNKQLSSRCNGSGRGILLCFYA